MPDITICQSKDCPIKQSCYRFTANPNRYQSYFMESPYDEDDERCEYYIKRENVKQKYE